MTAAAIAGLILPFEFDPLLLRRDLALIDPDDWSPHYNVRDFGGDWQGVALRSPTGSERDLHAAPPGETRFTDTPLLAQCHYIREVLAAFQCPLKSVRLLSLAPGSFIREHSDHALGYEEGEIRIHVPVRTNPSVEFYVCGERLLLEEGRCYYVNVNLPHRVNNRGDANRIHLVIDAAVNSWVRDLFASCGDIPRSHVPPMGIDEFSAQVFSDEKLRNKLRSMGDRPLLLRAIQNEAAARGFHLNEADIEASQTPPQNSSGWLPTQVSIHKSKPIARWIYAPDHRFTEPFFEDSVRVCMRAPFTKLFRREMPLQQVPRVSPAGFIFHMSRCGSTLISRSLAAAESTLVISEAPPLDTIIQTNEPKWIEWIVSALAHGRDGKYIVKLDAWHIRSLPLLRSIYPDVPWIFVYRDPLEVLVSQLRQPGLQASPGAMDPAILGLTNEDVTGLTRQQWCARVLEGFMTSALSNVADPNGMFVDYKELPEAICGRIAKHFKLDLSAEDEARVEAAQQLNAKNPWAVFESDAEAKQKESQSLQPDPALETLRSLYFFLSSRM